MSSEPPRDLVVQSMPRCGPDAHRVVVMLARVCSVVTGVGGDEREAPDLVSNGPYREYEHAVRAGHQVVLSVSSCRASGAQGIGTPPTCRLVVAQDAAMPSRLTPSTYTSMGTPFITVWFSKKMNVCDLTSS